MSSLNKTASLPMSSFGFWWKVTRPHHCLTGALATYVIALLSDGDSWINQVKLAGPLVMAVGILGASLFHFGAHHKMYSRKRHDYLKIQHPTVLIALGITCFLVSLFLAQIFLPPKGQLIALFNVIAIILYSTVLARYWVSKNLLMGVVLTTPVVMGWITGHRLYPALPIILAYIFFIQVAREIRKDIEDIEANHGHRITLPMIVGIDGARKITGAFALVSLILIISLGRYFLQTPLYAGAPYLLSILILGTVTYRLLFSHHDGKEEKLIVRANQILVLALLGVRIGLY